MLRATYERLVQAGEHGYASSIAGRLAEVCIKLGKLDEAERFADLATETTPQDDFDAQARSLRARARLRALRGDIKGGLALAERAVQRVRPTDYLEDRAATYADLAEVRLLAGQRAAAMRTLTEALRDYETKGLVVSATHIRRRIAELDANPG